MRQIEHIDLINQSEKINLVEEYEKLKSTLSGKKIKHIDQFEGNIYNSRFVYLLPKMIARIRFWLKRKRLR